jgi:GNAT superfamily N-acetyltransferase
VQPIIRAYRPADLDAVYDICVRTGYAGQDARGRHSDDRLLGEVWAAPYVTLEPEIAHVLDDGSGRSIGYVIGTADTPRFARRYRDEWIPATKGRFGDDPRDRDLLAAHLDPERMLLPELADHPAHLHIDLLPEAQGRGFGRALMMAFLNGLRAAGVERVHLGMEPHNSGARAFYHRMGFVRIPVTSMADVTYLGRSTTV